MNVLTGTVRTLYAAAALLQVVLAVAVFTRAWGIALIFLGAAALFARGAVRGCSRNFLVGSILALAAPLLIGLTGIEPFEILHHLLRLAVLGGMLVTWHLIKRSASAPSPAPSA